ncbi:MAG: ribonuclease E/G [Alphaproteobacteria bacterium]|nr:MAG: ribonuclease E/G [alpha proteobacterium MED-G09]|tara:strand:- start:3585 stop:5759 length:2175 start_codon:yes stop_codon:yes gene_type:complete
MTNEILIDAAHQEEVRVAVLKNNRLEEYDFEFDSRRPIRGNIYLAKVTRVEPSLQAAFVDYGGNRNGFLPFSEIHPNYYQIPVADKEALIQESKNASRSDEINDDIDEESDEQSQVEDLGGDDLEDLEKINNKRNFNLIKKYKIQEVIKKHQILLIQVVKEERGNKGAAITTYTSIPGRYCVFMPNSTSGGGVSRRINNSQERKKLKTTLEKLNVPSEMGLIIRTAGAKTTSTEIKRDYKYLTKTWDKIKEDTLSSNAPALIYEDGGVIQRTLRDLYTKDVDNIYVEGSEIYKITKNFMKLLMPSHAVKVKQWKESSPIFQKNNIENQLSSIYADEVYLPSGGSLVLNQTEALVAIDVNSGSSTKYYNIEETAIKTNLEAATEIARQLRLRDMAGLVVIDFIDMEKFQNRRSVEKKLKESLKSDRSKIQVGKISSFGLLEMSRQRIRASIQEGVYSGCTYCDGTGLVRSIDSRALEVLRNISDISNRGNIKKIDAEIPNEILNYLINEKRNLLIDLESNKEISINFYGNSFLKGNEKNFKAYDINGNEIKIDKASESSKNNDGLKDKKQNKNNKNRNNKNRNNKNKNQKHLNENHSNNLKDKKENNENNKNKTNLNDQSDSKETKRKNNNQKNKKKESSVDKDKNLKNEVVQKNAKDLKETKSSKSNKIKEAETKLEKKEISSKAKKTEEPKNINHIGAPVKDLESKKENTKKTKIKAGWWNKD